MIVAMVTHDEERIPQAIRELICASGIKLKCHRCSGGRADVLNFASDADVLWFWGDEVAFSADMLNELPHCKALFRSGSGVDSLPVAAATARGVAVCNTPESIAEAVAEHTVTLLLALARRLPEQDRSARSPAWRGSLLERLNWHVTGRTLGLIGYGRIARLVERMMGGFQPKVLFFDPLIPGSAPLEKLLGESDFVSLHCPLVPETRHLMNRERLNLMKPGALLVNASRGGVIDEAALYDALTSGTLGGAALDVMEREPFDVDSPLLTLSNVIVTPHTAAFSADFEENFWRCSAEKLIALQKSGYRANSINL